MDDKKAKIIETYFSFEQVSKIYNEDYIGFNLKNLLLSGIIKGKFISIKDLYIRPEVMQFPWGTYKEDPYIIEAKDDKLMIARSIVKIGTFHPFLVSPIGCNTSKLYVFEGNHRIISLKLLAMFGEISDDFKVFCLIPNTRRYYGENDLDYSIFNLPVKFKYIIDDVFGNDILTIKEYENNIINYIKMQNWKFVNDYIVEAETYNIDFLIEWLICYPRYLRDLIFTYNKDLLPSKIINDESEFNRWLIK